MFCPNCKDEFREGFVKCIKCDTDLVETLPEDTTENNKKDRATIGFEPILILDVEKPLKIGAFVLIAVNFLYNIVNVINQVLPGIKYELNHHGFWIIILGFISTLVGGVMSGLLYYALGQIIALLKKGVTNEGK